MNAILKFQKLRQVKLMALNKTVGIQPKRVFGLRTDVIGNVHFTLGQEIIYPAAGVLVIQDYITNKQRYLRFPENTNPEIIAISPSRKLIAVAETTLSTDKTQINIYELDTLKKVKTLQLATEFPVQKICTMCFTCDSKGMAVLSQEPDAFITIYTFSEKIDTMVTGRASNKNYPGRATLLKCNPGDIAIVTVGGENMLKIMNKTEKGFGQLGTVKGENIMVTALTWLTPEIIIAGSADMELCFIEGGEFKAKYNIANLDFMDLTHTPDADDGSVRSELSTVAQLLARKTYPIKCLTTFPSGFAFATHNMVHVFEKDPPFKFIKKTLLTIPVTLFDESLYVVKDIAINEQQDTIIATTMHNQIFIGQLFAPETMEVTQIEFKFLGEPLHIDSIIDLSVCSWKSIAMTASKDHTVRIWNYESMTVELLKKFLIDIRVIALHPSGMFAAIGFTDVLRLFQIQLKDLKIAKSFNYPMCTVLKFSNRGHYLAAGCEKIIAIISVFTFQTVMTLKGHHEVLSLAWSTDDRYLVSSGKEGSIYEWDSVTGERVNELVQKGTLYRAIDVASDQSYIVGVTHSAYLREISKSQMVREFRAPDESSALTTIAFSRSDQIMFTANDQGALYNIKMPFLEHNGGSFSHNRFYHKAINKLSITHDDKILISAGEDGTLVFWTITNVENRVAEVDEDLGRVEDILIPRSILSAKEKQISLLQIRISEQIAEFNYQKQQGETFHSEQMREIHENYCAALEDLKTQNSTLQAVHVDQLNELTATITKANEKHQRELEELEANFNEKIIVEYEKQKGLQKKMDDIVVQYEKKLSRSSDCLQETIESLEQNFRKQLVERQEYVQTLLKEMKEKEKEFKEYCRQVEIDHDRNMVESQLSYEKRLKDSDEIIGRWRGDAGVLKKKNSMINKECDELRKEIELMHSQQERFQEIIKSNQKDIDDLKRDVHSRDNVIKTKEKMLSELNKRTQELEKYKQALTHKMNELKMEIEPRETEIREKKERIFEMERELKTLQQNHLQANLKLSELKDKYFGAENELKIERSRAKTARSQLMRVCSEIYEVSNYIQYPDRLKEEVMRLHHRYSNSPELKKTLTLDADVQNEFNRHRDYFEKVITDSKSKQVKKKASGDNVKMLKENVELITELNRLRKEYRDTLKQNQEMQSLLGISTRTMLPSEAKKTLEKAIIEKESIENAYKDKIDRLEEEIQMLIEENHRLRSQLS